MVADCPVLSILKREVSEMNCAEFSDYMFYGLPWNIDILPAEARQHLDTCPQCRFRVKQLENVFELMRQRYRASQAKVSLAGICGRVKERLKSGELPEVIDVACEKVRPFLPLAVDPLGLLTPPCWLEEHLAACGSCWQEFRGLEEFSHILAVAEMPPALMNEIFAGTPPKFLKKVRDLQAIHPEQITCEQARLYYWDVAKCNLEIPLEVYRHIRCCASCKEQVKQVRSKLEIDIPQVGTEKFEQLISQSDSSG